MTPSTTPLRDRLAAIRARREALLRERQELERRPCTRAEAGVRVREHIAAMASHVPVSLEAKALWFTGATPPELSPDVLGPLPADRWLGAFVIDLARPLVEARLAAALDAFDFSAGITTADREAERQRFGHELARLERDEEHIVCGLEQAGEDVDRRGDCDPALVVADDAALA